MHRRTRALVPIAGILLGPIVSACSTAALDSQGDAGTASSRPSGSPAAGGAGTVISGAGGPIAGGSSDAGLGASFTADSSCASVVQAGEAVTVQMPVTETVTEPSPVAVYIMQDRSSSMVGVAGNPNGWSEASGAINAFVADPASAGIDVGIGFFPPLAGGGACNGSDCALPAVPVAALPQNGSAITAALTQATPPIVPPNLTPMECAIRGAVSFCQAHTARTSEQCVAILVTDGAPDQCDPLTADLAAIAAAGKAAGVLMFTLGMSGANFTVLDAIAQAGGTDCDPNGPRFACDVQAGQPALLAALRSIRHTISKTVTRTVTNSVTTTLECQWKLPRPPPGQVLDKSKVNVQLTGPGGAITSIGAVPSSSQCPTAGNGWYYDDPNMPTQVLLCPRTCDLVKNTPSARVDVILGCQTVPAVIQ